MSLNIACNWLGYTTEVTILISATVLLYIHFHKPLVTSLLILATICGIIAIPAAKAQLCNVWCIHLAPHLIQQKYLSHIHVHVDNHSQNSSRYTWTIKYIDMYMYICMYRHIHVHVHTVMYVPTISPCVCLRTVFLYARKELIKNRAHNSSALPTSPAT